MSNVIYFFEAKITSLIPCIISSDLFNINIIDRRLFCFLIYTFTQMVVLITGCPSILILVNSWLPSDTIWQQRSGSTLAQVMVCCLKVPSHCLKQCWLVRNVVWPTSNSKEMLRNLIHNMCLITLIITTSSTIQSVTLLKTRQIWGIWKLRPTYSPETPNLGQNRWCFVLCDLEIWWMTLENNRASLLCCFKLCVTFHSHRWIQTWVTVRKRPIWVKFDDF